MSKIKKFDEYINETTLFRTGGKIGGEHKKYVSDEDIESGKARRKKGYQKPSSGISQRGNEVAREKTDARILELLGINYNDYNQKRFIDDIIRLVDYYKSDMKKSNQAGWYQKSIEDLFERLPKKMIEVFNIDFEDKDRVANFVNKEYDKFLYAVEKSKELYMKLRDGDLSL